jgi:6-phosphogluconolactonase (cycloisomerase 2 family)
MVAFNPDAITVPLGSKFLYASNGGAQTISTDALSPNSEGLSFTRKSSVCFNGTSSPPVMRSIRRANDRRFLIRIQWAR